MTISTVHDQRGFTLLEVLIAVAIFAMVATSSFVMLQQSLKAGDRFQQKSQQLADLQLIHRLLERDIHQIIARSIRDEYDDEYPAVTTEQLSWGLALEMTVGGRRNPLKLPRSNLQRVRYLFDGEKLIRRHWLRLDRAPDPKFIDQTLINDVQSWQLRFLINDSWENELSYTDGTPLQLQAIEITLGLQDQRSYQWLFNVTLPSEQQANATSS